jgi:hypothetical protein
VGSVRVGRSGSVALSPRSSSSSDTYLRVLVIWRCLRRGIAEPEIIKFGIFGIAYVLKDRVTGSL